MNPLARIVLWNGLILGAILVVLSVAFEVYLRTTRPFMRDVRETEFVPGVGKRLKPGSEVQWTNNHDFWTVSQVNSLGFLDREPPPPERVAASCHVAIVGDSFVEATQVPIADKLQVRLEDMAQKQFPDWDVTTAAYGHNGTSQLHQLYWWDAWISQRPPKLVVLVFVHNDVSDNYRPLYGLSAPKRTADGQFVLAPLPLSDSLIEPSQWLPHAQPRLPWAAYYVYNRFRLYRYLRETEGVTGMPGVPPFFHVLPSEDPGEESREVTAFVLDQWQKRTRQAGTSLVILATSTWHANSTLRELLVAIEEMASARGIPVVDQLDYIARHGGSLVDEDFQFARDGHWTPKGHQWAAEALLEWMAANPEICLDQ